MYRYVKWFFLPAALGIFSTAAFAQEACDSDLVQSVIDQAAEDNECNADGVYISPDIFLLNAEEKCLDLSDKKCRKCIEGLSSRAGLIMRYLAKDGFVEKKSYAELKVSFNQLKQECGDGEDVQPTPDPEEPSDRQPGEKDPTKVPSPSPTKKGEAPKQPSPTPKIPASPTPNPGDFVNQFFELCPCDGFENHVRFMECINFNLAKAVDEERIPREVGGHLYNYFEDSKCSVSEGPIQTPAPSPSPESGI